MSKKPDRDAAWGANKTGPWTIAQADRRALLAIIDAKARCHCGKACVDCPPPTHCDPQSVRLPMRAGLVRWIYFHDRLAALTPMWVVRWLVR